MEGVANLIGQLVSEFPIRRCSRARKAGVEFVGLLWIMYSLMRRMRRKKERKGRLHSRS